MKDFDRNASVVQALTPKAHRGYQKWHRYIDNEMVKWLKNNEYAEAIDFWKKLYELYNTPDMIARFGRDVLDYIKERMK